MNAFADELQTGTETASSIRSTRSELLQDGGDMIQTEAVSHTLRRSGRKAVRFSGWKLIEAIGSGDRSGMWYDLNMYRTVAGAHVVELIARRQCCNETDLFRAEIFKDLGAAATWLEDYRCADDAPIPDSLATAAPVTAWLVLQAMQLRQCVARIEEEYHSLLSEVFAALDLVDVADDVPSRLSHGSKRPDA